MIDRNRRGRVRAAALAACMLGVAAAAAPAQGAKVTETAPGGVLIDAPPPASPGIFTSGPPLVQTFQLSGKNVKKKQILDVNLTINTTGSAPAAFSDLRVKLKGPDGFSEAVFGDFGQSATNLTYDAETDVFLCNPFRESTYDCNYSSGATPEGGGTFTGLTQNQDLAFFRGRNPKGTWTLTWTDQDDTKTSLIGTTTLEVKTGRKFAKE